MGIARSTYYDRSEKAADDTAIVEAIATICDEFEHYGWRRVQAALRQQGLIVNHKKIRRLLQEEKLLIPVKKRFVITTDSDHDQPILSDRTKDMIVGGPDWLLMADLT